MSIIIDGTTGISGFDGSASTPALQGNDTNTGIFFPAADTIAFAEGGAEVMRIDSSGNVGIGATSPKKRLTVSEASSASTTPGTNPVIWVGGGNVTANTLSEIGFTYGSNTTWSESNVPATVGFQLTSTAGFGKGALTFCTRDVTTDTAPTERMRIDSSGNVGIGTTNTSSVRTVIKGSTSNGTTNALKLIDSADADIMAVSTGGDFYLPKMGSSTGTTVVLTSGNYLVKSSSSIRYKKDVEPIDIGLDFVMGLNPVKYNLKDEDIPQVGFIAEDFPDTRLVSESMVDPADKSKGMQKEGVNYAQIVAPLVKAIQEQQTIINDLKARIETLETK
jgi:hypothetical protein